MPIDSYVLAAQPQIQIVPSLIGLGTPPFEWPDADSPDGWSYRDANIVLTFEAPDALIDRYGKRAVPRGVLTVVGIELLGPAVVDEQDLFRDPVPEVLAAAIGGVATSPHELEVDRPYSKLSAPEPTMARMACAAWYADRNTPEPERLATIIASACGGELAAIAVLASWARHEEVAPSILVPLVEAMHAAPALPHAMLELFIDRAAFLADELRAKFPAPLLAVFDEHTAAREAKWALDGGARHGSPLGLPDAVIEADTRYHHARTALATAIVLARRASVG